MSLSASEVVMVLGLLTLAAWLLSLREEDPPPGQAPVCPDIDPLEQGEFPLARRRG
jgi:hypothetical protein